MLENYAALNNYYVERVVVPVFKEVEKLPKITLTSDMKLITTPRSQRILDSVTVVHNLDKYKKRKHAIRLLPDIKIEIDKLIFDAEEYEFETLSFKGKK